MFKFTYALVKLLLYDYYLERCSWEWKSHLKFNPSFVRADGYNNIRIPAIRVTKAGTLLAFAEGREAGDKGDIDLIMRRSTDGGKTWSDIEVLWDDSDNS